MGHELQRQPIGVDDLVGHDVGHRHFRRRNEVVVLRLGQPEEVLAELGQLSGTVKRTCVDDIRHVQLGVTVREMGLEHVGDQRTVQPCHAPLQHREARAGDLCGGRGIQARQRLADFNMVTHVEIECARLAPATRFDVVVLAFTVGHIVGRDVGQTGAHGVLLGLDRVQLALGFVELVTQATHLGLERFDILTRGLGLADGLGATVTLGLQLLGARLQRLAARIQLAVGLGIEIEAAAFERLGDGLRVIA